MAFANCGINGTRSLRTILQNAPVGRSPKGTGASPSAMRNSWANTLGPDAVLPARRSPLNSSARPAHFHLLALLGGQRLRIGLQLRLRPRAQTPNSGWRTMFIQARNKAYAKVRSARACDAVRVLAHLWVGLRIFGLLRSHHKSEARPAFQSWAELARKTGSSSRQE